MSELPTLLLDGAVMPVGNSGPVHIGGPGSALPGPWDRRVARVQPDSLGNWVLVIENGANHIIAPEAEVIRAGRRYRLKPGQSYDIQLQGTRLEIRWSAAHATESRHHPQSAPSQPVVGSQLGSATTQPKRARQQPPRQQVSHGSPAPIDPAVGAAPGGGKITVGRAGCTLTLADSTVAAHHLDITRTGTGWRVVDRSGGEGFFADGALRVRANLPEEATLQVGRTELILDPAGVRLGSPGAGRPALLIRDLEVFYRRSGRQQNRAGRPALRGITFSASERTVTAVVGPSGAGKSTLCKALLGEMPLKGGEILFGSADLSRLDNAWPMVSYVPQNVSLPEELSTRQAITYAARLRMPREDGQRIRQNVDRAIHLVDLQDRAESQVSTLSGGQKKRVSIALELVTDPLLLLLDEPTSGLDEGLDRSVMQTLQRIAQSGTVVVVVTHSTANLDLADQVLALQDGGVQAYIGPPSGLLRALGASNHADAMDKLRERRVASLRQRPVSPLQKGSGSGGALTSRPAASGLRAVAILLQRELVRLFGTTRRSSTLGAMIAPCLATAALLFIATAHGLDRIDGSDRIVPSVVVVIVFLSFFAMALAATRLVEDYEFTRRERRWGLSPMPVVISRLLALGGVATAQALLVNVALFAIARGPHVGSAADVLGFLGATLLLSWSSVSVGLLLSTLQARVPPTIEWALYALMAVAAVGITLTGLLLPLGRSLQILAYALPVRWGASALAATLNLAQSGSEPAWVLLPRPDLMLDDDLAHLLVAFVAMALLTVGYALMAAVLLERRTKRFG